MAEPPAIFISYRRSDAGGYAWALRDYLTMRFDPDALFFDRENIDAGTTFPDRLREAVEGCRVLLAVIAPDWLEAKDGNGRRRLDNEHDWVRNEIALALALGKTVIPVLFGDDTPPPPADRLPEVLQPLASLQVKRLRGDFSEYDAQRQDLVRVLGQVPGIPAPRVDRTQPVIGIPPEQVASLIAAANEPLAKLTAQQQDTIRELERKTGVGEGALRTFFRTLGEQEVPPERYAEKLGEIAEKYRNLLAEIAAMPAEEPEIARLKEAADAALQAGDLDRASQLHVEMLELQDQAADRAWQEAERKRLDAAATAARLGEIALTGLRYLEAAKHFAAAASRVPGGYEDERFRYLDAEASALYRQGDEKGDNAALRSAIERYHALLSRRPRTLVPLQWAATQNKLGIALQTLGWRESGIARLEEAVAAYRAALEERTRERVSLDWAATQNNLGNALQTLGWRERGTARLEEAVTAYRAALEERTRERVPLDWAKTQNNLGNALGALGERESGTVRLEEAVAAFRAALEERTRERVPLDWAMTQNNLGNALWALGERESGTTRLEEAVAAYRAALEKWTRDRVPLQWATTQSNLGVALQTLGEREGGMARLMEALAAYRAALEERTRERVPLDWAMTQNNLGNALRALGERESGTARLDEAVVVYRAALEVRTRDTVPLLWAKTKKNLGDTLRIIGERKSGRAQLQEAVAAYRDALEEWTLERVPLDWAMTQNNLGLALATLGERTKDPVMLRGARETMSSAFEVFMQAGEEHRRAGFENRLRQLDEKIAALTNPKP